MGCLQSGEQNERDVTSVRCRRRFAGSDETVVVPSLMESTLVVAWTICAVNLATADEEAPEWLGSLVHSLVHPHKTRPSDVGVQILHTSRQAGRVGRIDAKL